MNDKPQPPKLWEMGLTVLFAIVATLVFNKCVGECDIIGIPKDQLHLHQPKK